MSKLAGALLAFQTEAPSLHRDSTNPHFRNRYLSLEGLLEAVRPALNKHGLTVLQFPTNLGGIPALRTKLLHAESGEFEEDTMPLVLQKQDPQGQGSAITYARRYSLMAILGLVADEDDDGNAGSGGVPRADTRPVAPSVPQAAREPATPPGNFPIPAGVQEELAASGTAPDSGLPQDVVVHFGKNAGTRLGDMTKRQVQWYAENDLRPNATPADKRLKGAAQTLLELDAA